MNEVPNITTVFGGEAARCSTLNGQEKISRLLDMTLAMKSDQNGLPPRPSSIPGDGGDRVGWCVRYINGQCE